MDLPPDVAANVLSELPRLARAVKEATGAGGINIVQVLIIAGHVFLRMQFCYLTTFFSFTATQNNGASAGQMVFHAHIHVIPRYGEDDGNVKVGASASEMISPDVAGPLAALIQKAL
jgi:diadenosine tetraphosphate (Ap4A) HIT family hydrolase